MVSYLLMIGMRRLYMYVRRSRSSAMDGISLGSPPVVPELERYRYKKDKFLLMYSSTEVI